MKKILIILLLFFLSMTNCMAVDFDTSIDEDIRKDYNLKQSEETLPSLPNVSPSRSVNIPLNTNYNATGKTYTLKNGTKITLASQNTITDYSQVGTKISFVSQNNIQTKDGTLIQAGTLFKGTITDSHPPQITGNGGLIELTIDEIYYNGVMSKITTKTNRANSKHVFFSDIKGQRMYWKNTAKAVTPGKKVFNATKSVSSSMYLIPVINIISWCPITAGAIFYTANAVFAPVIAVFSKGKNISLPAGTIFEIKISGDNTIKG